jgi:acyl carrier protein
MTKREFFCEIESMLGESTVAIQGDEPLEDLAGWDSMAIISFIAMVDEKLGISLRFDSLTSCKTVGDLVNLCEGKVQ